MFLRSTLLNFYFVSTQIKKFYYIIWFNQFKKYHFLVNHINVEMTTTCSNQFYIKSHFINLHHRSFIKLFKYNNFYHINFLLQKYFFFFLLKTWFNFKLKVLFNLKLALNFKNDLKLSNKTKSLLTFNYYYL